MTVWSGDHRALPPLELAQLVLLQLQVNAVLQDERRNVLADSIEELVRCEHGHLAETLLLRRVATLAHIALAFAAGHGLAVIHLFCLFLYLSPIASRIRGQINGMMEYRVKHKQLFYK